MFNGEEDYYKGSYFTRKEALEPKTETIEPIHNVEVEPPSAEKMLRLMRKKITGKGLKEL